jgi:D-xylulose reductase
MKLAIRDIEIDENLGPDDVRINIHTVGVCGSDVHYYEHGHIGPYIVKEPMILGHEASGTVTEVGARVKHLKVGDRVCMEPGIPRLNSRATISGMYNLDPSVSFWATPPIHGCLRPSVIHPAAFTFKLPDNVTFAEGALVEPLAIGMWAATKAKIKPGDAAVVFGAGPIGLMAAYSALAGGCSRVIVTDVVQEKLNKVADLGPFEVINTLKDYVNDYVKSSTDGWGVEVGFDATGNPKAIDSALDVLAPGGRLVLIGCPMAPVPIDVIKMQGKEIGIETIFRYVNMYPKTIAQIASGALKVKGMITEEFTFDKSIEAFEYAINRKPDSIKTQIVVHGHI